MALQASGALASYMEWTCQQDGTYFLEVTGYGGSTGTFAVEVTPQAAGSANDPCSGTLERTAHHGLYHGLYPPRHDMALRFPLPRRHP